MLQDRPVQHHRWRCPYCRYSFLMTVDDASIRIGDSLIRKHTAVPALACPPVRLASKSLLATLAT